jgi:hypothetical protein
MRETPTSHVTCYESVHNMTISSSSTPLACATGIKTGFAISWCRRGNAVRVMLLVNHAMVLIYKVHVPLKRARNFQLGLHQCRLACKTFLRLHSCNSLFSSRLAHSKTRTRRTFNVIPTFVKAEVPPKNNQNQISRFFVRISKVPDSPTVGYPDWLFSLFFLVPPVRTTAMLVPLTIVTIKLKVVVIPLTNWYSWYKPYPTPILRSLQFFFYL